MPSALFDRKSDLAIEFTEQGATLYLAAEACRISHRTIDNWVSRGKQGEAPYAEWYERLQAAQASVTMEFIACVRRASVGDKSYKGDWRAAAFWLSRRRPREFAEKEVLRQAANEAVENDEVELSIPVLENYLSRAGYKLVKNGANEDEQTKQSEDKDSGR